MGFFYSEAKASPKPARKQLNKGSGNRAIPIQSLNELSCSVCPLDAPLEGRWDRRSPKMKPSGSRSPLIYLLGTGPNEADDSSGIHWSGEAGHKIVSQFGRMFDRDVRSGHITQCMPPLVGGQRSMKPDIVEIECCRNRVVSDIEASKPLVVVGVGDIPLHWATGLPRNADLFRGTMIATRIGKHPCWYYPILYPHFVEKQRSYGKSEFELALEHDIDNLLAWEGWQQGNEPTLYEPPYDSNIEYITGNEPHDLERLEKAFRRLAGYSKLSVDIETNGFKPADIEKPQVWSAAIGTFNDTVAFALDHPDGWGTQGRRKQVWSMLGDFLLNSGKKIAHNLAFEMLWFAWAFDDKLLRLTEWDDTMSMAHTLDERDGTKSLDVQCRIAFGFFLKAQSKVDVSRKNWWSQWSLNEILRYNGMDAKWTYQLAETLRPKLASKNEFGIEHERKVRLAPTLVMMEEKGLPIDQGYARELQHRYDDELESIISKLHRCPEIKQYQQKFGTFSPSAPEHVLKLMKDICQRDEVRVEERDGSIRWTSDESALSTIPAREVPSAPLILEYRTIAKMKSTYIDKVVNGESLSLDGRLHSAYNSMKAVTGRLSSDAHNWPKHKHSEARGVVAAPSNEWMIAADYGQLQFRIAGMVSEDRNLVEYCWTDYDCHMFWAERIVAEYAPIKDHIVATYKIDWDEKGMKTLRQDSKNMWVFPKIFGASNKSCAAALHMPEDIAVKLDREFWDEFKGVLSWQNRIQKFYEKHLYVETLTGRRRRGPMTKNELINHPIQGTEADIVLEAMTSLSERSLIDDDPSLQPNFNGHDDLTFLMPDKGIEKRIDIVAHEMCKLRYDWINVPLVVEVSIGTRWDGLKKLQVFKSNQLFHQRKP